MGGRGLTTGSLDEQILLDVKENSIVLLLVCLVVTTVTMTTIDHHPLGHSSSQHHKSNFRRDHRESPR
jgi:hypothetical protein